MYRRLFCLLVIIGSSIIVCYGQKYKDIYPLLVAQRYDEAETPLKSFLLKNPEHPNANLQMALIYDSKAKEVDYVINRNQFFDYVDSATLYYTKARTLITEKEIQKRDDYYQNYNRRDLRTGKFTIRLSDVQYDIDDRISSLSSYFSYTKLFNRTFEGLKTHYNNVQSRYKTLTNEVTTIDYLYMYEDTIVNYYVTILKEDFDSLAYYLQVYQDSLSGNDKLLYAKELVLDEIVSFPDDGQSKTDFYDDKITLWDYAKWIVTYDKVRRDEIIPLKKNILYVSQYTDSLEQLLADNNSYIYEVPNVGLNTKTIQTFELYDSVAFPVQMIAYKRHKSFQLLRAEKAFDHDTTVKENVFLHIKYHEDRAGAIDLADSLLNTLKNIDIGHSFRKYATFLHEHFEDPSGVKKYLQREDSFILEARALNDSLLNVWNDEYQWGVYKDNKIPVFLKDDDVDGFISAKYKTLSIDSLGNGMDIVSGYYLNASYKPQGFVAYVMSDRQVGWFTEVTISNITHSNGLNILDANADFQSRLVLFYLLRPDNGVHPSVIAKINSDGSLVWSDTLSLPGIPQKVIFEHSSQSTKIFLKGNEDKATVVYDKDGELIAN